MIIQQPPTQQGGKEKRMKEKRRKTEIKAQEEMGEGEARV